MNVFTVSFFGHRQLSDSLTTEKELQIGLEAFNHKADMLGFQLHQSAFDYLDGLVVAGDADQLSPGADGFDDQLQNSVEQIMFKRIPGQKNVKFQMFSEILKIVFP